MKHLMLMVVLSGMANIASACDLTEIIEAQPNPATGSVSELVQCGNPFTDVSATQVEYKENVISTTWTYRKDTALWVVVTHLDVQSGSMASTLKYGDTSCSLVGNKQRDTVLFLRGKVVSTIVQKWNKDDVMDDSFSAADSACMTKRVPVPLPVKERLLQINADSLLLLNSIYEYQSR
jgi:hypothetical protein